jgi:hypothetical protein
MRSGWGWQIERAQQGGSVVRWRTGDRQRQGRILDERTADCVVGRSIALAPDFLDFAKFEVSFSAVN